MARTRKAGNEGHRDETERFEQRKEEWRLYRAEGWSLRDIGAKFDLSATTVKDDIEWYQRYLANEMPETFEAWRVEIITQLRDQYKIAKNLLDTSGSALVQASALRQMTDITSKLADISGISKGIEPPKKQEQAKDTIIWDED